ncbi:uncharacterized protein LOC130446432 isoform X2 [Diorhabda sublineata]|uniref:uncharacterized protein LOC130446432 isoform X2 n=1 Tax=Diorhabda sublineata TaxID=1163346 RepID=UPI0024E14296|nr:uncharacterized protein LOC130446432 isoform X2 [Diorhabda sublineata]
MTWFNEFTEWLKKTAEVPLLLCLRNFQKFQGCSCFTVNMERIFKIKTKTNRVLQSQYPSERRYSASIVIGLSVVFLQLCFYSILMGVLIVQKLTVQSSTNNSFNQNETEISIFSSTNNSDIENFDSVTNKTYKNEIDSYRKMDSNTILQNSQTYVDLPTLMCSGCFLMAAGFALCFITASTFSTITALIGLLFSLLTCLNLNFNYDTYIYEAATISPITFSLTMNIIILSLIGLMWSILSAKVAYVGMRSSYPDDMIISKGRHVEVSTVKKGNGKCTFPSDILDHFPSGEKLARYLPKKDSGDLPKAESSLEYRQRVDRFLSEVPEVGSEKSCT